MSNFVINSYRFVSAATNSHSIDLEDSSSQYLSITDASQTGLDLSGDLTLEAWIKFETFASTKIYCIISKWDTDTSYLWRMHNDSGTHKLSWNFHDGLAFKSGHVTYSAGFSTGTWYHVALVFDISANQHEAYVNGSSVGTVATVAATSIKNGTAPFYIGRTNSTGGNDFDGLIDDVRVWNDIRTSTEISDNYQLELAGTEANLQGYWKLNNDLTDETSNGNDLTNNNSAVFSTDTPF